MTNQEVVNELNDDLYQKLGDSACSFWTMDNGYIQSIVFNDVCMWDSENEGRSFDEEKNEYEDMLQYVKDKMIAYTNDLINITTGYGKAD